MLAFCFLDGKLAEFVQRGGMNSSAGVTGSCDYTRMLAIAHDCNVSTEVRATTLA